MLRVSPHSRGEGMISSAIVGVVRLYQRTAPPSIRGACRFTPTCSEYTICSVQAYGPVRGLLSGVSRLRRCRPPNGGADDP